MPWAARMMLFTFVLAVQSGASAHASRQRARTPAPAEHPPVTGSDGVACTACHADVIARPVMHGPVAAGNCSTCHVVGTVPGQRRVTLKGGVSSRDTARLCVTCHQETTDRLAEPHRHAPVAAGDCTACHDPHGSPFRFQLQSDGNRACTACHEDIAQALAQPHVHAPAAAACGICHDAHAASQPSQLRAPGNVVCLACHLDRAVDAAVVDGRSLFGRRPPDGIEQLIATGPRILLDASLALGHPTVGHPVDARPDPNHKGQTLGCASCHNPHGSAGAKLLRFGATGVSSLCVRCHSL
jgi:predicted CXXCH cytochrome family protein